MFNAEKFSEILNKIINRYDNISDFANIAGMSRSYISKYIHKKLPSPPTPKVLEKISENSNGITNYDELMQICGYLDSNISSQEIIAKNICKKYEEIIDNLYIPNLDKEYIFNQLITQNEYDKSIINKLNNFIEYNYGITDSTKVLYNIITEIDQQIKNITTIPDQVGIPLYAITKVPMYKISYFPFKNDIDSNCIAVKIITDKMIPLLGPDDIAIIELESTLVDGQTVLLLIDDCYYEIAKVYSEADICKLYFMNSKYEEIELSRIKIIGEVIASQNKSAFKKKKGGI